MRKSNRFFMSSLTLLDSETLTHPVVVESSREITPEESRSWRYAYRDGALARNSQIVGKLDSTAVLLTKETLLQLAEACDGKHNCSDGTDAILMHWATYPMDYPDPNLAGRQTVVFEVLGSEQWFGDVPVCPPFCPGNPCPKNG